MKFEISIAIFNEEESLEAKISELMHFLDCNFVYTKDVDFAVIIADNGSTDKSQSIAKKLENAYPNLSYTREDKLGVGRILKRVWKKSSADYVGYMDLDLATDLSHLKEVLQALEDGNDIVCANRLDAKSQVIARTAKREFLSRSYNFFARLILGTKFKDGQCGFKFLKREVAQKLISTNLMSDGLFFASQILIFGEWLGYKIHQLPVKWTDSPASKIRLIGFSLECFREILKTRKLKKELKKF